MSIKNSFLLCYVSKPIFFGQNLYVFNRFSTRDV